jgi:glycine/D-amino acid oxidase-like deaminating enzyme/nitrite reductase/ring-hydroxylating ferredoxin subunit
MVATVLLSSPDEDKAVTEIATKPYWTDTASLPRFPELTQDLTVDVVVIGAGITGITAAYLIKSAGLRVALLERGRAAMVDTGHTTAHLTYVTDVRLSALAKAFGRDQARAVWDAGRLAIEQIETNIDAEEISCEFRSVPGYLHEPLNGGSDEAERAALRDEAEFARELGFDAAYVASVPFVNCAGIRFDAQALFHPRKYLSGLLDALPGEGSHVFEQTTVDDIEDAPLRVKSGSHSIRCDYVVVATHTPLMGKTNVVSASLLQTKLALYTSYAIGAKVASGTVPEGAYWETADPYHYLRVDRHRGFDYVIFGGEDHKTGQVDDTAACFEALEETLEGVIPEFEVTHRWSGQVIETNDGLPYIGETSPRQFAATGFSGNGMTFGTFAAMMARDAALGRSNPWRELFDVHRTKLRGGTWDYLKENKDYLYYLVRDRFAASEKSLRAVPRGEGRLVDLNGEQVAAYRNEQGVVTLRSPVCTHMGCLVGWNDAGKTWDCPCHGSRFKPNGDVLAGPAESPLAEATPKAKVPVSKGRRAAS